MKQRLTTHLLDFDQLSQATYGEMKGQELSQGLSSDFNAFLTKRARLVKRAAERLAAGECVSLESILKEEESVTSAYASDAICIHGVPESTIGNALRLVLLGSGSDRLGSPRRLRVRVNMAIPQITAAIALPELSWTISTKQHSLAVLLTASEAALQEVCFQNSSLLV